MFLTLTEKALLLKEKILEVCVMEEPQCGKSECKQTVVGWMVGLADLRGLFQPTIL